MDTQNYNYWYEFNMKLIILSSHVRFTSAHNHIIANTYHFILT